MLKNNTIIPRQTFGKSAHLIKYRQIIGGRFEYWGVNVDDSSFAGPCAMGEENPGNTRHDRYTGFVDNVHREIYENDKVAFLSDAEFGGIDGVVVWGDGAFFFEYIDANKQKSGWPIYQEDGWYLITGNTHGIVQV